jgi:Bacterial Ig-like domain
MRNTGKAIAISLSLAAFVIAGMLVAGGTAHGSSGFLTTFNTTYGTAGTALDTCSVCHIGIPTPRNNFAADFADAAIGNHTFNATLDGTDSDGDGFTNLAEIMALTFPGDNTSFPAAVDNTAPTVDATFPADGADNVVVNTLVVARFSEPINTATVIDNSFIVNDGGVVNGTIAFSADNTTATFTSSPGFLDNGVTYTATLTTGIEDLAGNPLADNVVWTFTTAADNTADITAPSVVSTSPDNNASPVAVNSAVVATFSEPVDPASVNGASFTLVNGGAVAGTISVTDNTVTFTPSADLAALTVYTATLSTAVTDLAGVPLDNNYVWTFTTGTGTDVTPPTVLSTSPADGATGVLTTTTISATFSEAIMNVDGIVTNGVDNVDGTISITGSTATFTPSANLASSTTYTVTITAAEDLAGNPLAAPYTWTFTTRAPSQSSDSGGSCSINGSGGSGGGGALLFLTLLAILVTLRLKVARARR